MKAGLPYFTSGEIVKGFGRGSKQLGIPTANFPQHVVDKLPAEVGTGTYFGFASVDGSPVYKMVMSIGWNPYFKNEHKSMEVYILHKFENENLYGKILKIVILGYLRPEMDFDSLDGLIKQIHDDIKNADTALDQPNYAKFRTHQFFNNN